MLRRFRADEHFAQLANLKRGLLSCSRALTTPAVAEQCKAYADIQLRVARFIVRRNVGAISQAYLENSTFLAGRHSI
jgi:hypothetical protein